MSRDNYLYVGKKDGRYVIVRRTVGARGVDIEPDEVPVADATTATGARLMAERINTEEPAGYGISLHPKLAGKLRRRFGWVRDLRDGHDNRDATADRQSHRYSG